jgi:hypothetical protein
MVSTDWGRLDNLPYKPAGEFAKYVTDYSHGVAKGLEASMQSDLPTNGGAKRKPAYTKTDKKIKIGNRQHCIYLGARGAKYVKMDGKFKSLNSLKK